MYRIQKFILTGEKRKYSGEDTPLMVMRRNNWARG